MKLTSLEMMPEARPYSQALARSITCGAKRGRGQRRGAAVKQWGQAAAAAKRAAQRSANPSSPSHSFQAEAHPNLSSPAQPSSTHLVGGAVLEDALHGAENLLLRNLHLVGHVAEHSGLHLDETGGGGGGWGVEGGWLGFVMPKGCKPGW